MKLSENIYFYSKYVSDLYVRGAMGISLRLRAIYRDQPDVVVLPVKTV